MGPTASGKSDLAEQLADRLGLQLVNADAFMVYRGLDVGTNKPRDKSKYALLDIVEPSDDFGVGDYVLRASALLEGLFEKGTGAVLVGGTGLYVRALFEEYKGLMPAPDPSVRARLMEREQHEGLAALAEELSRLDPETAYATDLKNPVRVRRALERLADPRPPIQFRLPPFDKRKFVLDPPQTDLDQAIARRTRALFQAGWAEEVRRLLASGLSKTAPALRAIGYQCVIGLIEGRLSEEEAMAQVLTETRQYAKRQRTWLRTEPRATVMDANPSLESVLESLA
jgi:tRNA dimethylallyltransferase